MDKTENFEIYGRKLAYNEDVKKFFKIWWKYSFGKERIFPEVVKIMQSEKSEQEKVADILAAVEDHFKNPKDVYADKKPTKSIHGIAYNSFEDEKLEEFHSTCLFGVPAYNNTYTLYDFVDEFLDRSVAYEIFNHLVRAFQKFKEKGSTGLKINQMDFDLKKEYNEVYRFKSIHYGFEEKMTPSLITDYFSRKKRNDSIQLFAVDVLFSDIQGNSRKAQEIRFFNYILDSVYSLVDIFYYELFIMHIVLSLEDGGYIDEENISDFDLNKSNNMLLNLESAKDKVAVIVHAIRLFPGNIEVYRKAAEYGLKNQELAKILRYLTYKNGFDSQLLKILKSFIKNFNIRESFQYNKNAMDFIADFYNIDRTQYYKSIYKDSYEKVLKQFDSLAEMIKSNKISDTQLNWVKQNSSKDKIHNFYFFHEPAYPTGDHIGSSLDAYRMQRDKFWTVVDSSQNSMAFCGHEHNYTRRHINSDFNETVEGEAFKFTKSVYQVTTGTFRAPIYKGYSDSRNVDVPPVLEYHFAVVDVTKAKTEVTVYNLKGEIIDHFEQ
jgi:hypothetical protein